MKYPIILAAAIAVVLPSSACGSSHHPDATATYPSSRTSATSSPAGGEPTLGESTFSEAAASGPGAGSPFCALARRVGRANLGLSSGNLDPDPNELLGQIDRLDALAPVDLKHDFDVFAAFEHSVLKPGSTPAPTVASDTTAALEHVSSYFTRTCGVH
jgi:hypothetical protein